MLVKNWMSKEIITIDEDDSLQDAVRLLKKHEIRMLPVTKKDKLVGIVTDRDLRRASALDIRSIGMDEIPDEIAIIPIRNIMTKDPITVPFDYTLEETAESLLVHKISGLPVVDHEGKIVGAITQSDMFKAIMLLAGYGKRGVQFAIKLVNRPGTLKQISDIIRDCGGRIASVQTSCERVPDGFRTVYFHVYNIDRPRLESLFEEINEIATILYIINYHDKTRKIFTE